MTRVLIAAGALTVVLAAVPAPSQAQTYPWCSRYDWSTYNCGFSTLQQCLANISGIGGICEPNAHYAQRRYHEPRRYKEPRRKYRRRD
jgi:hypothetical protein